MRSRRERIRNVSAFEAQSYSNDILPKARGESVRRNQDAEAYKARVVADAEGEASRFEQLLAEYQKAPNGNAGTACISRRSNRCIQIRRVRFYWMRRAAAI